MKKISFSWITPKILTFEFYVKNKTYSEVNFTFLCQVWSKLIEKCPSKIQDGCHEIKFFVISTSDRGDFPRIIVIALLLLLLLLLLFRCLFISPVPSSCKQFDYRSNGTFESPGYPSNYPHNFVCPYTIVFAGNKVANLTFEVLELEKGDYLEVSSFFFKVSFL